MGRETFCGGGTGLVARVFASRLPGQIVYPANPRDPVVMGGAAPTMAVDPAELMREE